MIISASRRTDIPAFFSTWFLNRIKEKYVFVRNPMNPYQISNVSLSPEVVDCIVFWTKNPKPLLPHISAFKNYNFYFQFTINAYGKALEPNTPSLSESIDMFRSLSEILGPNRTIWRYDPIILSEKFTIGWHVTEFNRIAQALSGYTHKCVISFLDLYKKTERNLLGIPMLALNNEETINISTKLAQASCNNKINISTCAEEIDLRSVGILPGKCIDDKLIEELAGLSLKINKDKTQRQECGCVAAIDIGNYNTCPHGCLYCYANYSRETVNSNYAQHDPQSPLLFGNVTDRDTIKLRKMTSCFEIQQNLF